MREGALDHTGGSLIHESREPMLVDTHHHFWNLEREAQPWLTEEHAIIRRTFEPEDLEPLLARAGVERTVLVQSACSDLDTDSMFEQASQHPWLGGVIAWLDLGSPERARRRLDELWPEPKLRGFRHLIHNEPDLHWILQATVLTSLAALEKRGMILELPCVFPRHLGDVPELAASFPGLTIVIDHLAKPPLGSDEMGAWATELHAAAAYPNTFGKISGLNTMLARGDWEADDLREAVAVAVDAFGPERLVCGSDWPVALLNGDYEKVWRETVRVVRDVAPDDAERLLAGNALRLYRLDAPGVPETGGWSWQR
jgi:L-fuconolactonase